MKKQTKAKQVYDALKAGGVQTLSDLTSRMRQGGVEWATSETLGPILTSLRRQGYVQTAGHRESAAGGRFMLHTTTHREYTGKRKHVPQRHTLTTQVRASLQRIGEGTLVDIEADLREAGVMGARGQISNALYSLAKLQRIERVGDVPHPERGRRLTPLYRSLDVDDRWLSQSAGDYTPLMTFDRTAPPCFPSEAVWQEYRAAYDTHPTVRGFCVDCTVEYKQKMIDKGLCERRANEGGQD